MQNQELVNQRNKENDFSLNSKVLLIKKRKKIIVNIKILIIDLIVTIK